MKSYTSLSAIQKDLYSSQLTCESLVADYLERINERASLNAFVEVFSEEVKQSAKEIDSKIANGDRLPLYGAVIAIKDVICYKGHVVTSASKILEGFESQFTATSLQRLIDAGALVIGRVNCDEFAMGSSNENSIYGAVKNATNEKHVPGGSSGGSAVAVQANLCLAAIGSDTGGSIRLPASYTGTVGFKPTYGRVSRYGLLAYASSFDQIGIFAHNVQDAALITETMAGKDPLDATSSSRKMDSWEPKKENKTYKIAVYKECLENDGLDEEIKAELNQLIEELKDAGHEIILKSEPLLSYLVPAYYILTTAEASSNLARYDGIHYGYRNPSAKDIEEVYTASRTEGFGPEVKRRIMLGTFVLSAGYYDAYYTKAQQVRSMIKANSEQLLSECDFILSPAAASTAFELGAFANDPIAMYLTDIFTVQANLAGLPGIAVPIGQHSNGLPYGFQLMAAKFEEQKLMTFADNIFTSYN